MSHADMEAFQNRLRQALYPDYYEGLFDGPNAPSREDHIGSRVCATPCWLPDQSNPLAPKATASTTYARRSNATPI